MQYSLNIFDSKDPIEDLQAFVAREAPSGTEVAYLQNLTPIPGKVSYTIREVDVSQALIRLEACCFDFAQLLAFAIRMGGVIRPLGPGSYSLAFQIGAKVVAWPTQRATETAVKPQDAITGDLG